MEEQKASDDVFKMFTLNCEDLFIKIHRTTTLAIHSTEVQSFGRDFTEDSKIVLEETKNFGKKIGELSVTTGLKIAKFSKKNWHETDQ